MIYGQVKLSFVTPQGSEKVVEIIGPGYSFGEALMFMDRPYILMAQALADSLLLHVAKQAVFEGLERDPGFAKRMLAGLSRRLHGLISDVESYSLLSGTQRVIGSLLRQDVDQATAAAPYSVTLPTSKAIVASRLNLTPEHFSRILHELAEAGLRRVMEGAAIAGLMALGALVANWLSFGLAKSLVYQTGKYSLPIQGMLDGILPGLLPLLTVAAATVGTAVGSTVGSAVGGAFTRVPNMMLTLVPASSDICQAESVVAVRSAGSCVLTA